MNYKKANSYRLRNKKDNNIFRKGEAYMKNTMEYKGYVGSVEFSEVDGVFFGKVLGVRALILYEGTNVEELIEDFHGAVDDYLILCEEEGIEPEK